MKAIMSPLATKIIYSKNGRFQLNRALRELSTKDSALLNIGLNQYRIRYMIR